MGDNHRHLQPFKMYLLCSYYSYSCIIVSCQTLLLDGILSFLHSCIALAMMASSMSSMAETADTGDCYYDVSLE